MHPSYRIEEGIESKIEQMSSGCPEWTVEFN